MLNWIWFGMMLASVLCGIILGRMDAVTTALLDRVEVAVMKVMLPLGGLIVLWMGITRLVERSGFIVHLARLLRPVMRRVFPDIPPDHPALGSIALNLGASMLGAGNAATPMGIRAMEQMNQLNAHRGVATNSMCMFLALNTSALTLVPATTIGVLSSMGAKNSTSVIVPAMLTTLVATMAGILTCKVLQRMGVFRPVPLPAQEVPAGPEKKDDYIPVEPVRLAGWKKAVLWLYAALTVAGGVWFVRAPEQMKETQVVMQERLMGKDPPRTEAGLQQAEARAAIGAKAAKDDPPPKIQWFGEVPATAGGRLVTYISKVALPFFAVFFVLYAALSGLKVFEEMVEGGKDGMGVTLRVIPYVVGMLVALGMFTASGALQLLESALRPVLQVLGFPVEVLPMALIRPLSGGAARGVLGEMAATHGPDSLITQIAATINGSTETTFYVAAVYFGSVGVKRLRHAIPAGLIADAVAMLTAVVTCRLLLS